MKIKAIADFLNEPVTRKRAITAIVAQGVVSYATTRLALRLTTNEAEAIIEKQNHLLKASGELLEFAMEHLDDATLQEMDEKATFWNIILKERE